MQQRADHPRVAARVATKADLAAGLPSVPGDRSNQAQYRGVERVSELGHGPDVAAGRRNVLRQVVRADRKEIGVELVYDDGGGGDLDHDAKLGASGGNIVMRQ